MWRKLFLAMGVGGSFLYFVASLSGAPLEIRMTGGITGGAGLLLQLGYLGAVYDGP